MRKIVVDGRYTYETDLDLKVGDKVTLPTPDWLQDVKGPTFVGVVTDLASDYPGPVKKVIGKANQ